MQTSWARYLLTFICTKVARFISCHSTHTIPCLVNFTKLMTLLHNLLQHTRFYSTLTMEYCFTFLEAWFLFLWTWYSLGGTSRLTTSFPVLTCNFLLFLVLSPCIVATKAAHNHPRLRSIDSSIVPTPTDTTHWSSMIATFSLLLMIFLLLIGMYNTSKSYFYGTSTSATCPAVELPPGTVPTVVPVQPQSPANVPCTPTSNYHQSFGVNHNHSIPTGSGLMGFGKFRNLTREVVYTTKYFYVQWTKKTVKNPQCTNMKKWIQFIRDTESHSHPTTPASYSISMEAASSPVTPARKTNRVLHGSLPGSIAVMY